jgi:hypothetical protein
VRWGFRVGYRVAAVSRCTHGRPLLRPQAFVLQAREAEAEAEGRGKSNGHKPLYRMHTFDELADGAQGAAKPGFPGCDAASWERGDAERGRSVWSAPTSVSGCRGGSRHAARPTCRRGDGAADRPRCGHPEPVDGDPRVLPRSPKGARPDPSTGLGLAGRDQAASAAPAPATCTLELGPRIVRAGVPWDERAGEADGAGAVGAGCGGDQRDVGSSCGTTSVERFTPRRPDNQELRIEVPLL